MKLDKWLASATDKLLAAGDGTARLDCLVLLEDELGHDRSWILAHPETALQGRALQRLNKKVARRIRHEPLAYIRGYTDFYGRKFKINKHVLEPRPESETMIDLLCKLVASRQLLVASKLIIVDIGTGSGALAITAKLEIPGEKVIATDIDPNCLKVARQNAQALGAKIEFLEGDLLDALPAFILHSSFSILLCNLPYVPDNWEINEAAAMEPRIAIFGGQDGLDLYRRMFDQITKFPCQPKYIFTESLPPQHKQLAMLAKEASYKLQMAQDFIQLFERI